MHATIRTIFAVLYLIIALALAIESGMSARPVLNRRPTQRPLALMFASLLAYVVGMWILP